MAKNYNLFFKIKAFLIFILRLILNFIDGGDKCIICGGLCYVLPVCFECIKNHFKIDNELFENRCKKCGRQLISTKEICSVCKEKSILKSTDNVFPIFSYRLWNKELLFIWKIDSVRSLSYFFAFIVNKVLKNLNYKIIVPVPPRKGKIAKNGWDQIDELCGILEKLYGYRCLKILTRLSSEEQKKLNREERLETIKNAYSLVNDNILKKELRREGGILPSSVCLIDDVCTTGSTAECCSEILKKAGIKEVNVVTLFTVD